MAQQKHTQVVDFSNPNADKIKSASTTNNMAQQTAKEKAKELYHYYLVLFSDVDYVIAKKKAKMCVRKTLEEILNLVSDDLDLYYKDYIFYEEVKTEIEKL